MPSTNAAAARGDDRAASYVNLGLGLLLWAYTIVRAARLSFTHDESLTYRLAARADVTEILRYEVPKPSNNHVLNSLLTKLTLLIGADPFALRLPNLLAHGLYLAAALLLARHLASGYARVLAFVVLTLNPFMLDFFSLCRGYGLACGFELMALYLLVKSCSEREIRPGQSALASLLAALCALANLCFLVFFLAFSATFSLLDLGKWALPRVRRTDGPRPANARMLGALALQLGLAGLLCAYVVPIGLQLREQGELYYGGSTGFWTDTVGSLLKASTYYKRYSVAPRVALQGLGVALAATALWLAMRTARQSTPRAALLCSLPLLTALICLAQHHLLGTSFPVDRTALFFVPMLAVALVVASVAAERRSLTHALLGGSALLLCVNAQRSLNLHYFAQWRYDASTEQMLEMLDRVRQGRPVRLGANWLFEPSINYYRELNGLSWLAPVDRSGLRDDFDYYFFLPGDTRNVADQPLRSIHRFETSRATLARRQR